MKKTRQMLIILRGAPASGKSTLAKRLRNFERRIVWLKIDNFKPFFAKDSFKALDCVYQTALAVLEYLLNKKFSVVMEGIFQNPNYITKALRIAIEDNVLYKVYEFKYSLSVIKHRDRKREGVKEGCRKPLGDKLITDLFQVIEDNPFSDAIMINTEENSIEDCVNQIQSCLYISEK